MSEKTMTRRVFVVLATLLGLSVIVGATLYSKPLNAAPGVAWGPQSLAPSVYPGQTLTIPVVVTANAHIAEAEVRVVPALEKYVQVEPASIANLAKGQTLTLNVTVSVPATALPETIEGTVQLRDGAKGNTIATPLPVKLAVVWPRKAVSTLGVDIAFPPNWFTNTNANSVYFSNLQDRPPLSTESLQTYAFFKVAVRRDDNPLASPINDWFANSLQPLIDDRLRSQTSLTVNGQPGIAIEVSEVGGSFIYIYVARKTDVIEISYPRFAADFLDTYATMLASLHIL